MAPRTAASTSQWTLDYTLPSAQKVRVAAPPGYAAPTTQPGSKPSRTTSTSSLTTTKPPRTVAAGVDLDELRQQKAWELATSPAKAVPMQAFMMYMSGSGIQIFSIMSVWFLLKQAVAGAMGVQQAFAGFDAAVKPKSASSSPSSSPQSFLQQKIVYVICQLGLLAVALWKIRSMGLLPDSAEDWAPIFGSWVLGNQSQAAAAPLKMQINPLAPVAGAAQILT
ncbi:hypothetical protein JCM10908_002465 [Rhodotorula pacifica]|uniref:chaperone EMC4 n=1 Tax=Rhodotorula pacifica TaxID=1495444 RepID=UPI0031760E11